MIVPADSSPLYDLCVPEYCCTIGAVGDTHAGSRTCSRPRVERTIQRILKHGGWAVGVGDYVEAIPPRDKRWDVTSIRDGADMGDLIPEQFRDAAEMFAPLRGRWLGVTMGNHEERWIRETGVASIWRNFCTVLGAPDLGYCALLAVRIWFNDPKGLRRKRGVPCDRIVRIGLHHGAGGGQTLGGVWGRPMRWSAGLDDVDLIFSGHTHGLGSWWTARLRGVGGEVKDRPIGHVQTGTSSRTYEAGHAGYAARAMYPPAPLGSALAHIYPDEIGVETIA